MSESIFTKIIEREIPADIVFESDRVIAFRDIKPQAEVHLLVVPKTDQYENVGQLAAADQLAAEYSNGEYRLVFNSGSSVGQTVFHVHGHVLSGALQEGSLA